MELGISSFTYGWAVGVPGSMPANPLSVMDLLQRTVDFDLTCLQVGDNVPLDRLSQQALDDVKAFIGQHHIRLEIGARKLTASHLYRYIGLAAFFESPLLRFVVDGDDYEPGADVIVSTIEEVIPLLVKHNITLGIENHDRFKAKALASIMDTVAHERVGICLDCVNSLGADEGLEWVTSVLMPYTVNLHIKDFTIQRLEHKMGFHVTGTPAGKGMTNVPSLLEQLSKYGRCQSAVLEQWVAPEQQIEDTVRKEAAWADEGIQYLRQLSVFRPR